MHMTDWKLLKTQYEILGKSVNDLSKKHDVSADLISNAIETQGWTVKKPEPIGEDEMDALAVASETLQAHHQAELMPRYITLETQFFDQVEVMISRLIDADDVKKMAEALAILKPNVMKAASEGAGSGAGANKIMIINKFDVPQPGDKDYIPTNAVLMGEHAQKSNGLLDVERADDIVVIEVPSAEDMN